MADVRKNCCHRAYKQLFLSARPFIALKELNLKDMTRRARPKREDRTIVKNQALETSGLNRGQLNVALGRLGSFLTSSPP